MGLFGKEDKNSANASQVKNSEANTQVATTSDGDNNTVGCWFKTIKDNYGLFKDQTCAWCDSPQVKEINRFRKQFADGFCHPLGDIYRSFPEELTKFKATSFGKYNYKERLFGLEAFTLLTAIWTMRNRKIGGLSRFMLAIRNSTMSFLLGGLLVAPEIYNPLIRSDF